MQLPGVATLGRDLAVSERVGCSAVASLAQVSAAGERAGGYSVEAVRVECWGEAARAEHLREAEVVASRPAVSPAG